ncbi:MAG TPA: hypothetical protein VME40_09065 [Caulobacteraceae bacterium]|nr:hypothetical protein [Caulobacteraceae bacterium]
MASSSNWWRTGSHGAKVVVSSRDQALCDQVAADLNAGAGGGRTMLSPLQPARANPLGTVAASFPVNRRLAVPRASD